MLNYFYHIKTYQNWSNFDIIIAECCLNSQEVVNIHNVHLLVTYVSKNLLAYDVGVN